MRTWEEGHGSQKPRESKAQGLGTQGSFAESTVSEESTPNWPGSASCLLSPAMARFQRGHEKKSSDPLEDGHDCEHRGHARYVFFGQLTRFGELYGAIS